MLPLKIFMANNSHYRSNCYLNQNVTPICAVSCTHLIIKYRFPPGGVHFYVVSGQVLNSMKSYRHITHACVIVYVGREIRALPVFSLLTRRERDISQLHKSDITLSTQSIFHESVAGAMCATTCLTSCSLMSNIHISAIY